MGADALCDAAQAALMVEAGEGTHPCSARGVVPSTALVQGAVASLQHLGFLTSRPAASLAGAGSSPPKPAPGSSADLAGSDSDQGSAIDSSDERGPGAARRMPEAVASSVAAGLCRMAGPETSAAGPGRRPPLALAPHFEGEKALQALLDRLEAYRP